MDIIVIKSDDDTYKSTSFYVRFAEIKLLKSNKTKIKILINNQLTNVTMRLSKDGDGYFIYDEDENSLNISKNSSKNNINKFNNDNDDKNKINDDSSNNDSNSENNKIIDKNNIFQKIYEEDDDDNNNNSSDNEKNGIENLGNDDKKFKEKIQKKSNKKINEDNEHNRITTLNNNDSQALLIEKLPFNTANSQRSNNTDFEKFNKFFISDCLKEILKENESSKCNEEDLEKIFLEHTISYEDFNKNSYEILKNQNTVFLYKGYLFNFKSASILVFSFLLYNKEIDEKTLSENCIFNFLLSKGNQIPKLFKNFKPLENICQMNNMQLPENEKNIDNNIIPVKKKKKLYRTFYPSSNQLKNLNLNQGKNLITFQIEDSKSNVKSLSCYIFLWPKTSKIVVTDIDGTITKSEFLGQFMPKIGKDWSQYKVTELFTQIYKNGYKILYLTARPLCQSESTREFLNTLFKDSKGLPHGPLLMSPDGLYSSFKRELIDKTPQFLKVSELTEVRTLYDKNFFPFYAGFGNKESDAVAYRAIGIDLLKIFIINKYGEIIQLGNSLKKNFELLLDICDELFPKCF